MRSSVSEHRTPAFSVALLVAVAIVALVVGYAIGSSSNDRVSSSGKMLPNAETEDWHGSRAQAEDAMRRWAPKGVGGHRTPEQMLAEVHQHYFPRLMAYPTKNCIQLMIEAGGVGGEPIYCYRANSLDLLEEYSNVE